MAIGSRQFDFRAARLARALWVLALLLVVLTLAVVPYLAPAGELGAAAAALLVLASLGAVVLAARSAPQAGWLYEHDKLIKFRAVCREKGLTTKTDDGGVVYPRLTELVGTSATWSAVIRPRPGQSPADWERAAPAFGLAYESKAVRITDAGEGRLRMRVGYAPISAQTVQVHDGLLPEDGRTWRERLTAVPVAVTDGGRTYCLPAIDTHTLVAGISGSGKGSVVWSLLTGCLPAMRAGAVRAWGFDPKRMELSVGRAFFGDRYANTPEAMVELLERAVTEMMARADGLAGQVRRFDPSPETPLNLLVIDELAYLTSLLGDRKLKDRAEKALNTLLALGRAAGFMCVGALQDPRKETLPNRDLWPTRIALKLPAGMVDLVLGSGAREAGALCDLIPETKNGGPGCGVAFVLEEGTTEPTCVRFTWCPDELIQRAAGLLDAPPAPPQLA